MNNWHWSSSSQSYLSLLWIFLNIGHRNFICIRHSCFHISHVQRMKMYIGKIVTELSLILSTYFLSVFCRDRIYTSVGSTVLLRCDTENQSKSLWIFEGNILYFNRIHAHEKFASSVSLALDYSLLIRSVNFDHAGHYRCMTDNTNVAQYLLLVIGL